MSRRRAELINFDLGSVSSNRTKGEIVRVEGKRIKMKGVEPHLEAKVVCVGIFLLHHAKG